MKKEYESPFLNVIVFKTYDVITDSLDDTNWDYDNDWGIED